MAAWSTDERSAKLGQEIARWLGMGYRIESRTEIDAVMVRGHRVNHVLHLILSLITLGFWIIVWVLLALSGGEKRLTVHVDRQGHVATTWV